MSTTVRLPLKVITWPKIRVSSRMTPDQRSFFESTMRSLGPIQDVVVREVAPGQYEGVAGKTRWQELIDQGHEEYDVKLVDVNKRTARMMNVAENVARGSWDYIDVAETIQEDLSEGGNLQDWTKVLNRSETWVRRTLALLELPEGLQQALRDGKLTPTHVYLAARMPTPHETMDALQTFITHGWNTSISETFVNNRLAQLAAARKKAVEQGIEYAPPPVEPEKLISFQQCLLCGYRVPRDQVTVQLACKGCIELAQYITSQLGPWEKCKNTVFNALQQYFSQMRPSAVAFPRPREETVRERTASEEPPRTPESDRSSS